MWIWVVGMAWWATAALFPVTEAGAEASFERLRRDAQLYPEDDLATLLERSAAEPVPPWTLSDADPFFPKILVQILAEAGVGDPAETASAMVRNLEEALGLYQQT